MMKSYGELFVSEDDCKGGEIQPSPCIMNIENELNSTSGYNVEHEESIVSSTLSLFNEVDILQHQVEVATHTSSPLTELSGTSSSNSEVVFQDVDIPDDCRSLFSRILERLDINHKSISHVLNINKKLQEDLNVLNYKWNNEKKINEDLCNKVDNLGEKYTLSTDEINKFK